MINIVMTTITSNFNKDVAAVYDGFKENRQKVGLGLINPNIYATPDYQEKKISNIIVGGISDCIYSGFERDPTPLILTFAFESAYNTILGFNIRYIPPPIRKALLKYVIDTNVVRIQSNQPMLIDYHSTVRAIPEVRGIVRRYKIVGLRVNNATGMGTVPLIEWPNLINLQSPVQHIYKIGLKKR
jgi:hypothetical protein